MADAAAPSRPQAVLFACALNAVRSPMAAALLKHLFPTAIYVASAGVRTGALDPFAVAAMAEVGIDISAHRPMSFEELDDLEGLNFDLIVTLSPEAHHKAMALTHRLAADVEYWPTADPADVEGNRAQRLEAYRAARDHLLARVKARFAPPSAGNE
jgi:protein-tyrosine-phosphatase